MYVCNACVYVCMYVMPVFMYVCMYVCNACVYVCVYVCNTNHQQHIVYCTVFKHAYFS